MLDSSSACSGILCLTNSITRFGLFFLYHIIPEAFLSLNVCPVALLENHLVEQKEKQIGRASCRERVSSPVLIAVVGVQLKTKS